MHVHMHTCMHMHICIHVLSTYIYIHPSCIYECPDSRSIYLCTHAHVHTGRSISMICIYIRHGTYMYVRIHVRLAVYTRTTLHSSPVQNVYVHACMYVCTCMSMHAGRGARRYTIYYFGRHLFSHQRPAPLRLGGQFCTEGLAPREARVSRRQRTN